MDYSAVKIYRRDNEFIVEALIDVNDNKVDQGMSELTAFDSKKEQLEYAIHVAKELFGE